MAFTDAVLAIICTSCAVPLWASGTKHFNPVRLVPFVTTTFFLTRLWEKQYVPCRFVSCLLLRLPVIPTSASASHTHTPRLPTVAARISAA